MHSTGYVAVLKRQSKHWEFWTYLQDALRDCFVCRLKTESIHKQFLRKAALKFQKAVEFAVSLEAAMWESQQLSGSLKVNALSLQEKGYNKCYCCGRTIYNEKDCYYKEQLGHNCWKKKFSKRVHLGKRATECKQAKSIRLKNICIIKKTASDKYERLIKNWQYWYRACTALGG